MSLLRILLLLVPAVAVSAAERIVTLGASVTEVVFALGAGGEVVARDMSSLYPEEVKALPDVGYFRTIGAEGVLAQNPTLILAAHGTGPAQQVDVLKHSGLRFVHLEARPSAESTIALIEAIGREVGREAEAAVLVTRLKGQLAEAAALALPEKPRVIFLMGTSGNAIQAAYDNTAAGAFIELVGGVNVLSGINGYKSVTPEAVLTLDPDVILHASQIPGGGTTALTLDNAPAWLRETRAFRANRMHGIQLTRHLVFGPRLGEGVLEVARWLNTSAGGAATAKAEPGP